jgi:hypothetical protein
MARPSSKTEEEIKTNKFKAKKKKSREFTKQIVAAVLSTYFVGVVIGAIVVLKTAPDQLFAFLTFIGAPTATTVGFYCWKAKNENINKHPNVKTEPNAGNGDGFEPTEPPETLNNSEEVIL